MVLPQSPGHCDTTKESTVHPLGFSDRNILKNIYIVLCPPPQCMNICHTYVGAFEAKRGCLISWKLKLQAVVSHLTWDLENELQFSRGTVSEHNHWAIFPGSKSFLRYNQNKPRARSKNHHLFLLRRQFTPLIAQHPCDFWKRDLWSLCSKLFSTLVHESNISCKGGFGCIAVSERFLSFSPFGPTSTFTSLL